MKLTHIRYYIELTRINKPVGFFLLLWPTLWALWLASRGKPNIFIVVIFILGVLLMRSAGCVINDFADRHLDKHVKRTFNRPLTSGKISAQAALGLFTALMLVAFLLVCTLNHLTIQLAFVGAALAVIYPFMKRFTHLPQIGLGLAFAWGVPMAFAAVNNAVNTKSWILFIAAVIWPVIYDTFYAMVDREDDKKIGIKSTAIAWESFDSMIIAALQILFIILLIICGILFHLTIAYFLSLSIVAILFVYQQRLIKNRFPEKYFQAFLNNQWVGMVVYIGIVLGVK